MYRKWIGFSGMLVVALLVASMVAQAQPREYRPGFAPDRARGNVLVTNDWQDEVSLSMWSSNRERIGECPFATERDRPSATERDRAHHQKA